MPAPRGSRTDLLWLNPLSGCAHRALLDHGHLSTLVIDGTLLGLMQTTGLQEGYVGIGRDEIDIVWRSATENIISYTFRVHRSIGLTPCNTEFIKQVLP